MDSTSLRSFPPPSTPLSSIDPSLSFAFLFPSYPQFREFVARVRGEEEEEEEEEEEDQKDNSFYPLFQIIDTSPQNIDLAFLDDENDDEPSNGHIDTNQDFKLDEEEDDDFVVL